jgi:teichuronic acid biosynthesis glycosyltransferase TuaC
MTDRLRVLIVTNLFPNSRDPGKATFNRQQFTHLSQFAEVEVVAALPWRPPAIDRILESGFIARKEVIDKLSVFHPRFLSVPGVPGLNAGFLACALVPTVLRRMVTTGSYDVILGSYAYPDGCAAAVLGQLLRRPVVIKCHGSDLNRVPKHVSARLQIQAAFRQAHTVVAVSKELGAKAQALGLKPDRLKVIYNGIDRHRFRIRDQKQARARLEIPLDRELVLYVGNLEANKGVKDLLHAAERLALLRPQAMVVFVGDGSLSRKVHDAVEHAGGGRILAVGSVLHHEVPLWMAASDVLCVPSWDEGIPNVIREAHASGRPVVGTRVGGIPEIVHRPELGALVPPHDPARLADELVRQLACETKASAELIAELGKAPTWRESAGALYEVLASAAGRG